MPMGDVPARRTRLLRAADLAAYRRHLIELARALTAGAAAGTFVLVPTEAAARQLRRTLDDHLGESARPLIGSRAGLYDHLASRIGLSGRQLTAVEREAILAACARDAEEAGHQAPFHVRPALVAEMLALYDQVRLLGRTVDDFDRLLIGELAPAAESDRGASQLLEQTRFLAAAFRAYETRLAGSQLLDEHGVRARIAASTAAQPLQHLVIAVGDRPYDPEGFWPADVSLFTTLIGLSSLDVLATEAALDAGFLDRVRHAFVGIEDSPSLPARPAPILIVPANHNEELVYAYRDREDELEGVARRLQSSPALDRTGLVVARPLPYLYLAREVFASAGIAFEAQDTLPLAAEPYAAAVDVVLECAAANFTRRALMALLRSPHFRFAIEPPAAAGGTPDPRAVALLDTAMAANRYLGGLDRLAALGHSLTGAERTAAAAALSIAAELAPLLETRPLADQAQLLRDFLERHDRAFAPQGSSSPTSLGGLAADRRRRARAVVMVTLDGLITALRRQDPDAAGSVTELSAAVRRRLGTQTFAANRPDGGLRIVDTHAARFAEFDEVQIMGLVEGEWPERPRRNVFYPRALIAQLEPSRPERIDLTAERDQVRGARAMFRDLAGLAAQRTWLSTFALESDSVVEPSSFIDDLPSFGFVAERRSAVRSGRTFAYEALIDDPGAVDSPWAQARAGNAGRDPSRFAGEAGAWTLPRVSVSRLQRYLKCPFQFYVSNVLQVAEEPEDENSRSPLERGRFLHELFETFFHEWQARGRGRVTSREMAEARALFEEIAEPALRSLPPAEAGLERARLFGSAVGSGIADRVFAMEAERGIDIRERLMEYELDGEFTFTGSDGERRAVRLRAKIDRVDLLGDGTFRLIDYKTKYVPDRRTALQLPIYSACVRATLSQQHGRDLAASEAMYLSFEGPQPVVALDERGKPFDDLTTAAEHRLVAALNDIARGHYPPAPETGNLCTMCRFTSICRTKGGLDE
jgi:RecB family exonuclease